MYVSQGEDAICLCADCPQVCPAPPVYPDDLYEPWMVNGVRGMYIVAGVVFGVWTVALLTVIGIFKWRNRTAQKGNKTAPFESMKEDGKRTRVGALDYVGAHFENWLEVGFTNLGTGN